MVGKADSLAGTENFVDGIFCSLTGRLTDDVKYGCQWRADRLCGFPTCQPFRFGVYECDAPFLVRGNHCIADRCQCRRQ